jgi:hypothetical protein
MAKNNMKKSLKPFSGLILLCLNGLLAENAFAQPKPIPTTYTFFQGLTFPPFPGTIPRPAYGNGISAAPSFPLVEVPTPGLETEPAPPVRRRRQRVVEEEPAQPVRRRRRIPRPTNN